MVCRKISVAFYKFCLAKGINVVLYWIVVCRPTAAHCS